MESQLILSDKYLLNNYLRLIYLTLANKNKIKSSVQTAVKLRLINKKSLLRLYKKIIRLHSLSNLLNSYIVFSYCLLKKYIFVNLSWILDIGFILPGLAFFVYHFLAFYKAIFMMKMVIEWFPIKNWDSASPFKRFIRRSTTGWTKPFEKYFPSIIAWIIVINIVPILASFFQKFYITNDLANFARGYNFEEVVELVMESNTNFCTKIDLK